MTNAQIDINWKPYLDMTNSILILNVRCGMTSKRVASTSIPNCNLNVKVTTTKVFGSHTFEASPQIS